MEERKLKSPDAFYCRVMVMVLLLGCFANRVQPLQFEVKSGQTKCIAEEIKPSSLSVGKYHVVNPNEGHPLPDSHKIDVRVSSTNGHTYHQADSVLDGQFAFHTGDPADYITCFVMKPHDPAVTATIDFVWRSGIAAKDWTNVAKKGSVEAMALELKQLADTIQSIHDEMSYLQKREEQMQDLNRSTNSKMGWLSFLSIIVCLSVAGLQLWHLKTFFEKKKLI